MCGSILIGVFCVKATRPREEDARQKRGAHPKRGAYGSPRPTSPSGVKGVWSETKILKIEFRGALYSWHGVALMSWARPRIRTGTRPAAAAL